MTDSRANGLPVGVGLAALAILACFVMLVWSAAATKSETVDEGLFIGGGVSQVALLNPNIDLSHPPLLRWLAGASATWFGGATLDTPAPLVPAGEMRLEDYRLGELFGWTREFFYHGAHEHDRVLFWGRFPFALLGALAGVLIFAEVRRRAGDLPALAALAIFAFTPEVLAHSQWAHSDIAAALTTLALGLALARSLEQPGTGADMMTGALLGIAILAKLTALLLLPLVVALVAVFHDTPPGRSRALWASRRIGIVLGLCYVVILLGYLPEPRAFVRHEFVASDVAGLVNAEPGDALTAIAGSVLAFAPLPDSLLKGIVYTKLLSDGGHISFLHGEVRSTGFWNYYPVALYLKYPTPFLLLGAAGLVAVLRSRALSVRRKLAWILPPLVIFGFAMTNTVNIGVRSILPVAPFLALWTGMAVAGVRRIAPRAVVLGLVTLSLWSGVGAYPDFLAYFNPLAGGTAAADRWLIDSNLDWGQDLPELARTLQRRGIDEVRLAYFGMADPAHWNIEYRSAEVREAGWYAVSRSYLSGWWPPGDRYGWLRAIPPTELVGGSIALIEVRPEDLPR